MRPGKNVILATCCTAALLALVGVLFGKRVGLDPAAIGIIFSAVVGCTSLVFASLNSMHLIRNSHEPWLVTSREFHKEFWNDSIIAHVRRWICCDEAYATGLQPILKRRLQGQVTTREYRDLEKLDRFFALMLRVKHLHDSPTNPEQHSQLAALGYEWWLRMALEKIEVAEYARRKWPTLYKWSCKRGVSRDEPVS